MSKKRWSICFAAIYRTKTAAPNVFEVCSKAAKTYRKNYFNKRKVGNYNCLILFFISSNNMSACSLSKSSCCFFFTPTFESSK